MKNVNYIINGLLAIAVIILFVLHFSAKKTSNSTGHKTADAEGKLTDAFPVAYINIDSLLTNYNFSKDLNEIILKKQENARANYTQKARALQTDIESFQYKLQNGAFASRERAEQEEQRLMTKQQELQQLDEKLSQGLLEETQHMNEQLRDTIVTYLKVFNKDKGYQIIFSNTNGSPIFLADDSYNITTEVIEFLNKQYTTPSN